MGIPHRPTGSSCLTQPSATERPRGPSVRLACLRHAASVRPEPGSNSPLNSAYRFCSPPAPPEPPPGLPEGPSYHSSLGNVPYIDLTNPLDGPVRHAILVYSVHTRHVKRPAPTGSNDRKPRSQAVSSGDWSITARTGAVTIVTYTTCPAICQLHLAPTFEGPDQGDFIGVLEVSADGQPSRQPRDPHSERAQEAVNVH